MPLRVPAGNQRHTQTGYFEEHLFNKRDVYERIESQGQQQQEAIVTLLAEGEMCVELVPETHRG